MSVKYENYQEIRDKIGMTDYAVAKRSGVSKSTFSDWKSGRCCPKSDKLLKIAAALDIPIEVLLDEETQKAWLTADDTALLLMYKDLNEEGKRKVREYTQDILARYHV